MINHHEKHVFHLLDMVICSLGLLEGTKKSIHHLQKRYWPWYFYKTTEVRNGHRKAQELGPWKVEL